MNNKKVALIALTYNRIGIFENFCKMINNQTYKDFDFFVYDSGPHLKSIEIIAKRIIKDIKYKILHTDKNEGCWRRHELARSLASEGYDVILFLDDDILFPNDYVEKCISQYEENSYKSWWAWNLNGGYHYLKDRTRVFRKDLPVNYLGAGVSMMDAKIFLDDEYFNIPNEETKWIDDIWLSFYSKHILKWKLEYLDIDGISFGEAAGDSNALYNKIGSKKVIGMNKKEYVDFLKEKI